MSGCEYGHSPFLSNEIVVLSKRLALRKVTSELNDLERVEAKIYWILLLTIIWCELLLLIVRSVRRFIGLEKFHIHVNIGCLSK